MKLEPLKIRVCGPMHASHAFSANEDALKANIIGRQAKSWPRITLPATEKELLRLRLRCQPPLAKE
eukprot:6200253-Pleurochrysis_carterae.AAC.1